MFTYELTPAHWKLVTALNPSAKLDQLLAEGWEPFAATYEEVVLRKYVGQTGIVKGQTE